MTLTHIERVDIYTVTDQPPLSNAQWERDIDPQQVKVALQPAADGSWSVVSVAVHGPYIDSEELPGSQRCLYYSGERLAALPEFAREAMAFSLTVGDAA